MSKAYSQSDIATNIYIINMRNLPKCSNKIIFTNLDRNFLTTSVKKLLELNCQSLNGCSE